MCIHSRNSSPSMYWFISPISQRTFNSCSLYMNGIQSIIGIIPERAYSFVNWLCYAKRKTRTVSSQDEQIEINFHSHKYFIELGRISQCICGWARCFSSVAFFLFQRFSIAYAVLIQTTFKLRILIFFVIVSENNQIKCQVL